MTNDQLLLDAADDCEELAEDYRREAANMGPTKERAYLRIADEADQRAVALRVLANELRAVEPAREHTWVCSNALKGHAGDTCPRCGKGPCPLIAERLAAEKAPLPL